VVADASTDELLERYLSVIKKYPNKVKAELTINHRGSAKTRNAVRNFAIKSSIETEFVLLLDDDFKIPNETGIHHMIGALKSNKNAGLVGGQIVNIAKHRIDPEFQLPVSQDITNCLSSLTGFLFNGKVKRITSGQATTCFMLIRRELLSKVSYDENYRGSGYREESDFQRQFIHLGYSVLCDETAFVYHLAPNEGGCREKQHFSERIFWKSLNHTYFICKWNKRIYRRVWFFICFKILLISYRPTAIVQVFKGLADGYKFASRVTNSHQDPTAPVE
jgi:GT2 family glycosyltransferase